MIKLYIEESTIPNKTEKVKKSPLPNNGRVIVKKKRIINKDLGELEPKLRYNDDNEMEFTVDNKKYTARYRTNKDVCSIDCVAMQFCSVLKCTPSMLEYHDKPIIFDRVTDIN